MTVTICGIEFQSNLHNDIVVLLVIASSSQDLGPSAKRGRFTCTVGVEACRVSLFNAALNH